MEVSHSEYLPFIPEISRSGDWIIGDSHNKYTFKEIEQCAEVIKKKVPSKSLVYLLADNTADTLIVLLGLLEHDVVVLLLNSSLDSKLYDELERNYPSNVIIAVGGWDHSVTKSTYNDEILGLNIFVKDQQHEHLFHPQLKFLLPTSGSTGSPKLVRHSLNNLLASAESVSQSLNIRRADIALGLLPIYYTMGLSVALSHLYAGGKVYLTSSTALDPRLWKEADDIGVTNITGVPYTFEILAKLRLNRIIPKTTRVISQGGGKMRRELFQALVDFCESRGMEFIATYGQTEASARMSYLPWSRAKEKIGSIGIPMQGFTMALIDENEVLVVGSGRGEIQFNGNNVTLGYAYSLEDLAKGNERNFILNTGDIAYRDEEGFYFIEGRKSRFLKLFGLRVSLDEVESLISNEFGMEVVCGGTDDHLIIQHESDTDSAEILRFITNTMSVHLSAFKVEKLNLLKRTHSGKAFFESSI